MNKELPPSPAQPSEAGEPTPSNLKRRRLGLLVAALAVTGVSGCIVVPARPVRPRVRVVI